MGVNFQEIDSQPTSIGEISLRRRKLLQLDGLEIFEIKLNEEFLMSSLFHVVEDALADLALAQLDGDSFGERVERIDVVVGGLGLGYTAISALKSERVQSLMVVDLLQPVIDWHRGGLVPLGLELSRDPRCRLVQGDFFANGMSATGFDPEMPHRKFHAILLDIDHSPDRLLAPENGSFYSREGLALVAKHLVPGGVFALWSDDGPMEEFMVALADVFEDVQAHVIEFENPLLYEKSRGTVFHGRAKLN
jgi:spermidine synthase